MHGGIYMRQTEGGREREIDGIVQKERLVSNSSMFFVYISCNKDTTKESRLLRTCLIM